MDAGARPGIQEGLAEGTLCLAHPEVSATGLTLDPGSALAFAR
jgi:hypothetical protein